MIFGFRSDTVYAATELRNPGWNSSVTAAPPTIARRSSTVTLSPAAARYAAHVRPLCPPPMISASQRPPPAVPVLATAQGARRRLRQPALGDQRAHALREAAQADLALAQGPHGVAARGHARLDPLDERLVLEAHAAVDAPVEVACEAHLAPCVRVHVGDLADHGLGGRDRQELHEIDL